MSDEDRMEGEEPMLESMAMVRRIASGSRAVSGSHAAFPITVTGGSGSGHGGGVEGARSMGNSPSNLGMTLDQYMSQMVTTPASAAATSGGCHVCQVGVMCVRWVPCVSGGCHVYFDP